MIAVGVRCVAAAAAVVTGMGVAGAGVAWAQPAAEFYAGKTIDVIVSSGEGGVNDIYARLIADHLPRYLPGKPTMVPRNMPGAGGLRAVQFLYSNASRDGLGFGVVQRSAAVQPLLGVENANYDPSKFNWIGSTARETSIGAVWTASTDIRTLEDAMKRELIVGSSGVGNDTGGFPLVLNYFLGTKFKPVHGYKSGSEIILAMQRGEVQGRIGWSWGSVKSSKTADWIKDGKIKLLMQMGISKAPDLPDVPLVGDLARNDLDRQAIELVFAATTIGWPSVMPPGVPADRVAAVRAAYDATMKDAEFIRNAQKAKLELDPLTGKEIEAIVGHLTSFSPEVSARAKASLAAN